MKFTAAWKSMFEDSEDTWPLPQYNPGARLHLHALGVIAITYAAFERSIDNLYEFHPARQNAADDVANYLGLSIKKRIASVRRAYALDEKSVRDAIDNVLVYFQQCNRNRNELLHAEQYPAMFGGEPETLYLIKRGDKRLPQSVYLKLKLTDLRAIADDMRRGVHQCAEIHIYIRFRGAPVADIPKNLRVYVDRGPPSPIPAPQPLYLSPKPQS